MIKGAQDLSDQKQNQEETDQNEINQLVNELARKTDAEIPIDRTSFCNMKINVLLDSYNTTLGEFPLVFQVVAMSNGKKVYDNVVSCKMDSVGTKSVSIEKVGPEGSQVIVTQVYSGANYKLASETIAYTILSKNSTKTVNFKQTYKGGILETNYVDNRLTYDKNKGSFQLKNN